MLMCFLVFWNNLKFKNREIMGKEECIKFQGVVTDVYPNTQFKVKLENGHEVAAYLCGKMRKFYIRIIPGDR